MSRLCLEWNWLRRTLMAFPGFAILQWMLSFICLIWGLVQLLSSRHLQKGGLRAERAAVEGVVRVLREIEETLAAGLLPAPGRWEVIAALEKPWGTLAWESIQELRAQGGALLPTLGRLREFAVHHRDVLSEAESRSAQAVLQAIACAALVPLFGLTLYFFLPGIDLYLKAWIVACVGGFSLALLGMKWILSLAEAARWAGLPRSHRNALLAVQCAAEKFIALIRAGNPADIAWSRSCEWLAGGAPLIATAWGHSLWATGTGIPEAAVHPLAELGTSLRKSAQVSLMEGRPCLERAEAALRAFRVEMKTRTERELNLLSTRALKPLFLCVAPAILGILAFGVFLAFLDQAVV